MDDHADLPGLEAMAHWLEQEAGASTTEGGRTRTELAAWARSLLARARAEEASLRERIAALGDDYNRERAARQALESEQSKLGKTMEAACRDHGHDPLVALVDAILSAYGRDSALRVVERAGQTLAEREHLGTGKGSLADKGWECAIAVAKLIVTAKDTAIRDMVDRSSTWRLRRG